MVTLNSQIGIQDRLGGVITTVSLQAFWSSLGIFRAFDPKVLYDPFGQRWVFVAAADPRAASSALLVGVSATTDPTGQWFLHRLDSEFSENAWADFPSLGFAGDHIVVHVLKFPRGSGCSGSSIFALDKSSLYSGNPATGSVYPGPCAVLAPATTYDAAVRTPYLVSTGGYGPEGRFIDLWKIEGGNLLLYAFVGPHDSDSWGASQQVGADFAPQLGSDQRILTNDDRMLGAVYRNGFLWAVHTTFLPALGANRSAIQWYQIAPEDIPTGSSYIEAGVVAQSGRIDDPSGRTFYGFPSIAVNEFNDVLVGYSRFSGMEYASAEYAFRYSTDPLGTMRTGGLLKSGEAPYYKTFGGGRNRWGDYSATVVDPANDEDMWTIQQYATLPGNGEDRWSTWWGHVASASSPAPVLAAPTQFSFGYGHLNAWNERVLYLLNAGTSPLTIGDPAVEGPGASSFSAGNECDGRTVLPGSGCKLWLRFTPRTAGPKAAQLSIPSNAGTHRVSLVGIGGAGYAAPSPYEITFSDQSVGTTSPAEPVTITNTSGDELRIRHIDLGGGDPNEFAIRNDTCTGASIRQGAACTFGVAFSPSISAKMNEYRTLWVKPVGNMVVPQRVVATGSPLSPVLAPYQTHLGFGLVQTGQASTRDLLIINQGNAPLNVSGIELQGSSASEFAIESDGCSGSSIEPNWTCALTISFGPNELGTRSASLSISSNDSSGPHRVTLGGTGGDGSAAPSASLSESVLDYGSQTLGAGNGPSQRITVVNRGTAPLALGALAVAGSHPTDFVRLPDRDGCTNRVIAPGAQCAVDLAFRPQSEGVRSATLEVPSNDPAGPGIVTLEGISAAPQATLPSELSFGSVDPAVGATGDVRIINSGSASSWLEVTDVVIVGEHADDFVLAVDGCSSAAENPAGGACTITVAFLPTAPGVRRAELMIHSSDPDAPHRVALSGHIQDSDPPETTITAQPAIVTSDNTATFSFESDEKDSWFECSLDGEAFRACTSPHTTDPLGLGPHSFLVRAIDPAGNVDPTPAIAPFVLIPS